MEKKSFTEKLVLVTGGGSGIGKECCKLAAELGASIVVADINKESAKTTDKELQNVFQHQKHLTVQVDVSNSDSVSALSKEIYSAYNRHPSVIIHCAGILGPVLDSDKVPEETWHKVIDVQLKGTFLVNQTFAKLLKESGTSGSIVNISSIAKDGVPRFLAYSAAKAGICGITKTIAQEFGPYNIRCNVVAPGAITTPMQGEVPASARQKYIDSCALGRVGLPEEVASVCIFLGSDASSYVNGIVMEVHGGRIIS